MIITFWMYAYCLFVTPEQRLLLEARQMANLLNKYILVVKMIITFWMYVYCLFDTPEQRLRMEARRLEQALKLYTADYKLLESTASRIKTKLNTV